MFSKLQSVKAFSSEVITITDLVGMVKLKSDTINKIRSVEYKSNEYKKIKDSLGGFMPHGTFNSLSKDSLVSLSGYLFFDIDNLSPDEIKSVKSSLIEFGVNMVYVSPGGCGVHFLLKVDGLSTENFDSVYKTLFNHLVSLGFNVDKSAGGLARKAYISYDKDVYYKEKSIITIHNNTLRINNLVSLPLICYIDGLRSSDKNKQEKEIEIKGNDTFLTLIPISQLKDKLVFRTEVTIESDFQIKDTEFVSIFLPKEIKDGYKHSIFRVITINLIHLNKDITTDEVYSYIYWVNETKASPKMDYITLQKFINRTYHWVKNNDIKPFIKTKKIHISNEYTAEQKAAIGGKINAKLRQNETIKKILEAKEQLKKEGIKETRVAVAKITGLSIITIKRNWEKELNDVNDIELPEKIDDKQLEIDYKLSQLVELEEDDWFNNWEPQSKYTQKTIEDEDFGESDGIDGLIETINI